MSNMINRVKMNLVNDIWITSITHLGVELTSMATDIRVSLKGLQESIDYLEDGLGQRLLACEIS